MRVVDGELVVVDPSRRRRAQGPDLRRVDRRLHVDLGDARRQAARSRRRPARGCPPASRGRSGRGTRRVRPRRACGTGTRPASAVIVDGRRIGRRNWIASSRYTSKNSGRSVIALRCGARWLTSNPHAMRPLDLGLQLAQHLAGSACSQRSSIVRGNPPSPLSSDGAWVIGPHRYSGCSAFSVRCTPMSSPSYIDAACRAHGAGTISEAHVATPSRSAR